MNESTVTTEERPAISADAPKLAEVVRAIKRTRKYLLRHQSKEGYWMGELEADASVTAGYIPLMYFMTGGVDPERQRKVVNHVLSKQRDDGSWSACHGGPGDVNVSVQSYFALKLAGIPAADKAMLRAKDFILSRGGIGKTNVFTRIWLAIFGQFDWKGTPSVPPELVLLPDWFYLNIYEFGSWSRATIVALTMVLTTRPVCRLPEHASVAELYLEPPGKRRYPPARANDLFSWEAFFLAADSLIKAGERLLPWKPARGMAVRRVEKWLEERQESDGSWGGIMLPWIYSLIGLKSLGYPLDHPVIARGMRGLEGFIAEDESTMRLAPATSPVWDTAWAVIALGDSGLGIDHPALVKAARWLLQKEVRVKGDWRVKTKVEPGGWSFEFENKTYPDIDDTAVVPRALLRVRLPTGEEQRKVEAIRRGLGWVTAMQSSDGGWAAFDRDNNRRALAHIPFADFMTPLDPTSPDVTAHVLELMGEMDIDGRSLKRGMSYVKKRQEADGAWYGRWGVNYLYGTALVLVSLRAVGEDMSADYVRRAVSWLESSQNPDGGWGECCQSYDDPARRGGPSTASQTAWALKGLVAAGESAGAAAGRGARWLVQSQQEDGSWREDEYTGTGFPRAFYLRYDLYRIYFPLLALAQYRTSLEVQP